MSPSPSVVLFDLDDTLAPSKTAIDPAMADLLSRLLARVRVCIISGGRFEQFETQVLRFLTDSPHLDRLHVMPTCGTQYYRWQQTAWRRVYARDLSTDEKRRTVIALKDGAAALGLLTERTWGPVIEDRGSQITFSALGQSAPVDAKKAWDPDGSKKDGLRQYVADRVPDLEVRSGGSTSVDVTLKGVDKAYGVRRLCQALEVELDELLFIGDRLDETGNDYPVKAIGVRCVDVAGPQETATVIADLIDQLSSGIDSGQISSGDLSRR
jgi:phosphomannomutase